MNELIERLGDLSKSWTAQGDRFELDGYEANAQEMYGRAFGATRAVALIRECLAERNVIGSQSQEETP